MSNVLDVLDIILYQIKNLNIKTILNLRASKNFNNIINKIFTTISSDIKSLSSNNLNVIKCHNCHSTKNIIYLYDTVSIKHPNIYKLVCKEWECYFSGLKSIVKDNYPHKIYCKNIIKHINNKNILDITFTCILPNRTTIKGYLLDPKTLYSVDNFDRCLQFYWIDNNKEYILYQPIEYILLNNRKIIINYPIIINPFHK